MRFEKKNVKKWFRIGWFWIFIAAVVFVGVGMVSVDQYSRQTPVFCASCHNMEDHVDSYLNSENMDHVHYMANVGCKDCHASYTVKDELISIWKYVKKDYKKVFSRRKYDDEMCLTCHISLEYRAVQTDFLRRNPHLSHWPELRCGSCHISHGEQVDYCARCHENGGQRMTGEGIVPRADNPWLSK